MSFPQQLDNPGRERAHVLHKPLCDHRLRRCCLLGRHHPSLFCLRQDAEERVVLDDFSAPQSPRREGQTDGSVAPKWSIAQRPAFCWMISRVPLQGKSGPHRIFLLFLEEQWERRQLGRLPGPRETQAPELGPSMG